MKRNIHAKKKHSTWKIKSWKNFNIFYNNQTGFTPFFVNHGFEANFPGQTTMSVTALNMDNEIKISTNLYCSETLEKFHKCFQLVHQNLNMAAAKHTNILNIPHYFEIGDEAWLFSPVLSVKIPKSFSEFWTYSLTSQLKIGFVHVSRLKKKF